MALNYSPLTALWPSLPAGTTAEKIAAVNAMTTSGTPRDVAVGDVQGYLDLNGLLPAIRTWVASNPAAGIALTAAQGLIDVLESPHIAVFQMSNSTVYTEIEGMLNALAASPPALLSATNVSNLLALAATTIPWWQANGFPAPLTTNDAAAAGLV